MSPLPGTAASLQAEGPSEGLDSGALKGLAEQGSKEEEVQVARAGHCPMEVAAQLSPWLWTTCCE